MQRTQEELEEDVQEPERGEGRMELMQIPVILKKLKDWSLKEEVAQTKQTWWYSIILVLREERLVDTRGSQLASLAYLVSSRSVSDPV